MVFGKNGVWMLSHAPFIVLTATAMKTKREFVVVSFGRQNIKYAVMKMSSKIHVAKYFD